MNPAEENKYKQIRWRQRFENYTKAFLLLQRTTQIKNPSEAEQGGMIQFFEVAFELAWKTLKDYLESRGMIAAYPRDVLKKAYQTGILDNGQRWLEALEDRNRTTHIDDEEMTRIIVERIRNDYYPLLRQLYDDLKKEAGKESHE